jgi:putative serine protease PepD
MSLDDDADDDLGAPRPPLPPDDRLWRHPSELRSLGPAGAPIVVEVPRPHSRAGAWSVVVAAGLTGAVLAAGLLALSGHLDRPIVEKPVVEKVAVTPIVSTPMLKGSDSGIAALVHRLEPSIVGLQISDGDGTTLGSGVVFRDDGMLLTSAHLIEGADRIGVRLSDGRRLSGTLVGSDALTDVAVVDIDARGLPVAVLGSAKDLEVGAATLAVGSQLGERKGTSVSTGVISALSRSVATTTGSSVHGLLQTDAPIDSSAAGGALVDGSGAVIGIVSALQDADEDSSDRFGFATPIDLAHRVAQQLIDEGHATHGWLGIEGTDLSADDAAALGLHGGARVSGVDHGGPADRAGLDDGDVVTEIDGQEVESMPGLAVEMRDYEPGEDVEVGYWRDGKHETTTVEVGSRPPTGTEPPDRPATTLPTTTSTTRPTTTTVAG